jgi:transforming growth factor-beta-induced protein
VEFEKEEEIAQTRTMLMLAGRRTIVPVLLLCLLAATARAEDVANSTLADVIANATGVEALRELIGRVPGLLDSLDNATGPPLTVFAPTDAAFEELTEAAPTLVKNLAETEGWVVHLTDVLTYHVVPGKLTSKNLFNKTATESIVVTALNGEDMTVATVKNGTALAITDITDGVSNVTKPFDIMASNGVIHTIDRVLLPYWTTLSTVELGKLEDDYSIVVSLVAKVGLEDALSGYGDDGKGLTLFAPMNSAFDGINATALTDEQIKNILLYHVVPGVVPSTALTTGNVTTLQGGTIAVVVTAAAGDKDASVTVNGNPVVVADGVCNNGIVHVIDKVLMPPTTDEETPPEKCPPLSSVRSRKNRHRV